MVKSLEPGDRLRVEASDAAFKADLEAWVRRLGHELVEFEDGEIQRAVIEKRQAGPDALA